MIATTDMGDVDRSSVDPGAERQGLVGGESSDGKGAPPPPPPPSSATPLLCLASVLLFAVFAVFASASDVGSEDETRGTEGAYEQGRAARAVFEGHEVQGFISLRQPDPGTQTKIVVGLFSWSGGSAADYQWFLVEHCSAAETPGAEVNMTARHGALHVVDSHGLAVHRMYDDGLLLFGDDSIIGDSIRLIAPNGARYCAPIELSPAAGEGAPTGGAGGAAGGGSTRWDAAVGSTARTGDGRPIDELRGGTRGAACTGRRGAVASTNYLATQAGLEVLAQGGNAADAAAAVQFMLGVAQPESNGIGGGAFILHYNASTQKVTTIDGREEAPARFHPNIFCADRACALNPECTECPNGGRALNFMDRHTGGLPVGVPGTLAATARLLADHGSGEWQLADVLAPAITVARTGINMTSHLHGAIAGSVDRLNMWEASAQLYLDSSRTRPVAAVGQAWTNPDLAQTYERIGREGIDVFYTGEIARDIVSAVQGAVNPHSGRGGSLEYADMAGYRAVRRAPTRVSFTVPPGDSTAEPLEYSVYGMAPPSSGGATMGLILNLLEVAMRHDEFPTLELSSSGPGGGGIGGIKGGGGGGGSAAPTTTPAASGGGGSSGRAGGGGGVGEDAALAAATNAFGDTRGGATAGVRSYNVSTLRSLADAQNLAFADRNKYIGDPDFVEVPLPPFVSAGQGGLLDKGYARSRWAAYRGATQSVVPWGVPPGWGAQTGAGALEDDQGTTHFVVVDEQRNVASITTTIESNLGSSVVVPGRGILLNNELTDFDASAKDEQGLPNANAPQGGKRPRRTALGAPSERTLLGGKRPRSSMAPTIVLRDGLPVLAVGSPGGSTIIGAVANALLARLVHLLPLQGAVDLPRVISRNTNNNQIENTLCEVWPQTCDEFERQGYPVPDKGHYAYSTLVQAAELTATGGVVAAADTTRIDSGACGAI